MASKDFIRSLQKGQILSATVEDVSSLTELLCNFRGDLLLISNHSGLPFKKGDPIVLQVVSSHPLRFAIFENDKRAFRRVV